mmetsp:Transcript_75187/g.220411  ORF Transcript_75187/g.220411 Transcript_75187/m.220411 type:complete len:486 (+) Transcript_75187:81-1538(+)
MADFDDEPPFPALSPPDVHELSEEAQEQQSSLKQQAADALEDGQPELALERLSEAVALGCASALLYCRRAQLLLQVSRPRGAVNDCAAALEINPDSGKAFKIRARARALLEEWEQALADFQEGLKIDYDEAAYEESLLVEARARELRAARDAAARQLWEVVGGGDKGGVLVREGQDLSSTQVPSRLSTGAIVEELDLVGERLNYHRLSGTGPDEGWVSICFKDKPLLQRTGPGAAEAAAAAELGGEPPFPAMAPAGLEELSEEAQERQAQLKQQAADAQEDGDLELALERLTEAIVLGHASALMYSRRAQLLLRLGRPRAAAADCSAALELNPDSGKAYKVRARALLKLERWLEAHADFQQGLKIDYDEGTYEESLAAAERAKDMQQAAAERRAKEEERQRKAKEAALAKAAAAQAPAAPPQPAKPTPKVPPGAKGDGYSRCLVCGFKASTERDKQVHSGLQGHAGFYDAQGRLAKYSIISKGGG